MGRWTNEDTYDSIVRPVANNYGVPVSLVKAIIGKESAFRANAYRAEPAIADASHGLMQLLLSTAKAVGYRGVAGDRTQLSGLFDPHTNITYGVAYLADVLRSAGGNVRDAISAYNGGYRPHLAFGAVATKPLRLCLARHQTTGECIQWRDVKVGEYGNQQYVTDVLSHLAYFEAKERTPPTAVTSTQGASLPLHSGNRHFHESQADCRTSGAAARPLGTQIREAVTRICNLLFRRRKH